ncbi:SDR family NAD(P)-dependent oxidoreductase [Rhizobium sp. L1K21]|uniref:SDR family NAD(P)-dependent oxidoreductase n=1 Tax=Rhizobium sp. L1K21 TaxID=2954933 RepID=UPI0020920F68|nr:SDR family oxidoreductase [Rhizobium sp. L1K21]MCO6186949.1 SDR family oxidoreductase [Rhizobium sp. L1K21]
MTQPHAHFTCLQDAPVLITGGASGIGAALVAGFCAQGARVAFIDIDQTAGTALSTAFPEAKHPPIFVHADLSDVGASKAAVQDAAEALGGIQVLVNNAARDDRHDADSLSEDEWRASLAVNLDPVMFVTQAAMPHLIASGRGSVINFSSIAFLLNMGTVPAYGTAKAAIIGLTRTLAGRYGPDNVRVNALLPGMVVTERQRELWLTDDSINDFIGKQCIKRSLSAEDMVGPCLFLASSASAAITAQSIVVDGGVC